MVGYASTWRKSYPFIASATLIVVAMADFLIYGHPIGWATALLAAVLLGLQIVKSTRVAKSFGGRIMLLAAAGLLVALVEQPNSLNITYIVVCLATIAITNTLGWDNDFTRWLKRFALWLNNSWASLFQENGRVVRWLMRYGFSPGIAKWVAAWVLPILAASVFVGLFAWANPIISDFFSRLGVWIEKAVQKLPEYFSFFRILFWIVVAMAAWMLMRGRIRRRRPAPIIRRVPGTDQVVYVTPPRPVIVEQTPRNIPLGFVVRCLILFNIVFLVENALDTKFLWVEGALPHRLEYREYVRRGAYPLVAAALLAGAFVLVTFRPGSSSEKSKPTRMLVYAWIAQTILLTLSAAWRLGRYIEMSELTRLRVASIIWFAIVALGLAYVIARIVTSRSNRWLINVNALTALLILYPCCFVNFDGMIADFNAGHCAESNGRGSPLDIEYMQTLGPAALPALERARANITVAGRQEQAIEVSDELYAQLRVQLDDWRGWTWRYHRVENDTRVRAVARAYGEKQGTAVAIATGGG